VLSVVASILAIIIRLPRERKEGIVGLVVVKEQKIILIERKKTEEVIQRASGLKSLLLIKSVQFAKESGMKFHTVLIEVSFRS